MNINNESSIESESNRSKPNESDLSNTSMDS